MLASGQLADHDAVAVSADISQAPRGEHEDEEGAQQVDDAISTTESVAGDETRHESANRPVVDAQLDQSLAIPNTTDLAAEAKVPSATAKPRSSVSVKPSPDKATGGPVTPTVKKIINSGTFGAGTVKSSSTKPFTATSAAATKTSALAPALNKSTTSSSSPSKLSMASARASAPSTAPPSRRLSLAPPKSSASSDSKPPPPKASATATAKGTNATRPSVVSPASSVTSTASRPRAPVSESVKRPAPNSRQSLPAGSKPPTASSKAPPVRTSSTAPTKPTRTTTSISSIREVAEDGKVLEEMRVKLKELSDSLATKTEAVMELEAQIVILQSSLKSALADVETNKELAGQLAQGRSLLEAQLTETKEIMSNLQSEQTADKLVLESLQGDLAAAKTVVQNQDVLVQSLQAQMQDLEKEISSSKELEKLQASEASIAASTERDELLKAHVNEIETLGAAHAEALQVAQDRIKDLGNAVVAVDDLNAALARLKEDKEEAISKLSELEVEILELKESQELAEDQREQLLARIQTMEEELLGATSAKQQAIDEANSKEVSHAAVLDDIKKQYSEALEAASEERANVVVALEALKEELATSIAAQEQVKSEAQAALEEHARKFDEVEQMHKNKQMELSDQLQSITVELESQETYYNSKVDAVKKEHSQLLQDAFERAKDEAAGEHAQELQSYRASSTTTIEQIRAANQSALEDLKQEHSSTLESESNRLEKQISVLKLDLKATQDDLAKAKATVESARGEIETLTSQRDVALAAAASIPQVTPEHVEETARLSKELSNTKDDLAAVTDMLNLTKASLTEMSHNQTKELEEAATARAEDVMKLRSTHDEEVTSLVAQKSELLVRLSDLEGELATLKATISSETAVTKNTSNGVTHLASTGVTKEELQRLHEAHNLKMHDLQAEHEKAMNTMKLELEASVRRTEEVQQEVARKGMEIEYLEQEQEDSQEQITRLKEDMETLTERLNNKEQAVSA